MPPEDPHDEPLPPKIGPYTVLRAIGRGAMGVVYSAYDDRLDRKIAVKHLHLTHDAGPQAEARLLREAQALARVSHPNVVQVYEVGEHRREVYIAMEFVAGQTLRAWARGVVRPWREVLGVYMQAGRGLAAAHAAGLVHRDFKPDNVMIGDDGRVRVMDFGLARSQGEPSPARPDDPLSSSTANLSLSHTVAGRLLGTPAYMAPEQHIGAPGEARTDQFSFCVALHEALHGQRPFAGDDMRSLVANVRAGRLREPPKRRAPRWLRKILHRGLSVSVDRRWPSMQALLAAIERGQAGARRRLAAAGLVVVGALAAGAWGWHERQLVVAADRCTELGASIDDVWNDDARARVRDALVATSLASAATTADRVMPWIDRAAAAWAAARTDLCSDADRRALAPALLERASWCLDERRTAIEALVGELSRADAAVVQRAVSAAAALEDPAQCRDAAWLALLPAPPEAGREPLRAVQTDLLRAASLQAAGRTDAGLDLAQSSLAQAQVQSWPPLIASARHRVGSLLAAQGKHFAQAEAALEAAYFEAARAGATGVLADAAVDLVFVVGQELARPLEGQRWGRLAAVALASLEPRPGLRTASLRNNLANVHRVAGEYPEARSLHEQALEIREAALAPDHPDVGNSLNNLANIHFSIGDLAASRQLHARALEIRERAFGPEHPDVASSLNNLGNLDFAADALQDALARHLQALAVRERSLGPDHLDVANSLNNLAGVQHALGKLTEIQPLLARALAIRERNLGPDHPTVAESLSNLAIALESVGTLSEARALHERALAIYERAFGPSHPSVANSLGDLARLHNARGDLIEARRLHTRALAIREQALGPDHPDLADTLQSLATIDLELGAWDNATRFARRALAIIEANHGPAASERAAPLACIAAAARHDRKPG
jgi:tetratricopeptide (TPR) repeat protein/predicted Ser/Thr protein kinase